MYNVSRCQNLTKTNIHKIQFNQTKSFDSTNKPVKTLLYKWNDFNHLITYVNVLQKLIYLLLNHLSLLHTYTFQSIDTAHTFSFNNNNKRPTQHTKFYLHSVSFGSALDSFGYHSGATTHAVR